MPMLLGLVKSTLGSMLVKLATQKMLEWLLLWAAEMAVKSTKTPHDDKLLEKVKEALDAED